MNKANVPAWLAAYGVVILLAARFWGSPGAIAPLFLAISMPLALVDLRRSAAFAPWLLMTMPGAIALWWITGDHPSVIGIAGSMTGLSFLGVVLYIYPARREPKVGTALLVLALEIGLVAYFSGSTGSSGRMLRWLAEHGCSDEMAHTLTFAFRKTVHFTFYGAVGATALAVARRSGSAPSGAIRTAVLAALALASFDELRQTGYASRTGSAWDVLLDTVGAATSVGLLELRRRKAR